MNNPDFVLKRHEMFSMFYTIEQVNRAFIINDVVLCDNEDYSVGKRDFERHLCRILFVTIFCLFYIINVVLAKKSRRNLFRWNSVWEVKPRNCDGNNVFIIFHVLHPDILHLVWPLKLFFKVHMYHVCIILQFMFSINVLLSFY